MKNGHRNKPRRQRHAPGPLRTETGMLIPCVDCWVESGALVNSPYWRGPGYTQNPVCARHMKCAHGDTAVTGDAL